ncbi:MAG: hypothetical protein Q4G44_11065 [Alcaligenaceae bacterium]|nr:hypothetical protein [Alcaligenaceae bacterium]
MFQQLIPLEMGQSIEFVAGDAIQCKPWASTLRLHMDCLYYSVTNHFVDQKTFAFQAEIATNNYWREQHLEDPTIFLVTRSQTFTARGPRADHKFHGWRVSLSDRQPTCNDNSGQHKVIFISVQTEHKQLAMSTLRRYKFHR